MSVPLLVIGLALLVWALWSRMFRKATVNGPIVAAMGPRGAASIVFGPIAANALPGEEGFLVLAATCMVVLGSVVLHGVAGPLMVRRLWPAKAAVR